MCIVIVVEINVEVFFKRNSTAEKLSKHPVSRKELMTDSSSSKDRDTEELTMEIKKLCIGIEQ
jgi:hypothetical protein